MHNVKTFMTAKWKIFEYEGEFFNDPRIDKLIDVHEDFNIVVNDGRSNVIAQLLGLASGAAGVAIISMGVGASSDGSTDETRTRLSYEYLGNANRIALTNTDSETFLGLTNRDDIDLETLVVSSYSFYEKVVVQAVYGPSDGNNGQVFREYGLFSSLTLPGAPTSTSGVMFNRFIDPDPITKSGSNSVVVQVTLRL